MPKAFLSYAREDHDFAQKLTTSLEANGIDVWVDKKDILVGHAFAADIYAAIGAVDFLIAVVSRNSVGSKWVEEELNVATKYHVERGGTFILPVLIETVHLPLALRHRHYADFRADHAAGLAELLAAIQGHASAPTTERKRSLRPRRIAAIGGAIIAIAIAIAAVLLRPKPLDRTATATTPSQPPARQAVRPPAAEEPIPRSLWIYIGDYADAKGRWSERQIDILDTTPPERLRCAETTIRNPEGVNVRSLPGSSAGIIDSLNFGARVALLQIVSGSDGVARWARIRKPQADVSLPEGRVVDFAGFDVARKASRTGAATPKLADYGVKARNIIPQGSLMVVDSLAPYDGKALYPGNQNVLMLEVPAVSPSSFTLVFDEPLRQVSITRTGLYADTDSGIIHPAWNARAFDAEGKPTGDPIGEPLIAEHCKVPAATYSLRASSARIASVQITSDPINHADPARSAAFRSVVIERLVLDP